MSVRLPVFTQTRQEADLDSCNLVLAIAADRCSKHSARHRKQRRETEQHKHAFDGGENEFAGVVENLGEFRRLRVALELSELQLKHVAGIRRGDHGRNRRLHQEQDQERP
jgi:hypothetical protein